MYYSHSDPNANENENRETHEQPIELGGYRVEPWEEPPRQSRKKKDRMWPKITALCLSCALVGGLVGGGGIYLMSGGAIGGGTTTVYEGQQAPTVVNVSHVTGKEKLSPAQIYATYVGSTVGITTELVSTNYFGQQVQNAASGSGFVVSSDGYIVTNYHVIEDATSIKVTFVDGKTYDATLRGGDKSNDIAVLKIDAENLTPVVIGSSDDLVVGDQVYAIGNPLGELTYSMTSGIVSALDRNVTMSDGTRMNYIQTDTAINSGNSGGALFNEYGQVVGIVSAKLSSSGSSSASVEGLGFAIPMGDVKNMLTDIIQHGYITGQPYMGIINTSVSGEAQRYGTPAGSYVMGVVEGSCSEKAGLQTGDIITAIGDAEVTSSDDLQNAMKDFKAGDSVKLTVNRSGEVETLTITFDEKTEERSQASQDLQTQLQQEQQQQQYQQGGQDSQGGNFYFPFGW